MMPPRRMPLALTAMTSSSCRQTLMPMRTCRWVPRTFAADGLDFRTHCSITVAVRMLMQRHDGRHMSAQFGPSSGKRKKGHKGGGGKRKTRGMVAERSGSRGGPRSFATLLEEVTLPLAACLGCCRYAPGV